MSAEAIPVANFVREYIRSRSAQPASWPGELWEGMNKVLTKFYPGESPAFTADFATLGNTTKTGDELIASIQRLVGQLQKA
jgi:hypothetical protein